MSRHDPMVRMRHMLDHAREAAAMSRGRSRANLASNRMLSLALVKLVEIIGEAANQVHHDIQVLHPQIPWSDIVGMRHRLIHRYDEINYDVLWETVTESIPALIAQLEQIIPPIEEQP